MKKTQEIIGLPIISIFDGTEIGTVKNIIISAEDRAIKFVIIDSGLHLLGAKVISTEKILGIGEYAVTVEDDHVVSMISKIPAAIDLLEKGVIIKGAKMLTKKGRLAGEISEIFVDEDDNCQIKGIEFKPLYGESKMLYLPDEYVITYGKHLVIVTESIESSAIDDVVVLEQEPIQEYAPEVVIQIDLAHEKEDADQEDEILLQLQAEIQAEENEEVSEPVKKEVILSEESKGIEAEAGLFEDRQKQYLLGRIVAKTILDKKGNVIIEEGSVITEDLIQKTKKHGKMAQLVMHNKA